MEKTAGAGRVDESGVGVATMPLIVCYEKVRERNFFPAKSNARRDLCKESPVLSKGGSACVPGALQEPTHTN